jgi:uncharacterized protein (DUF1330 family)
MDEYGHSFAPPHVFQDRGPLRGYWIISARVLDMQRYNAYLEVAVHVIDGLGGRMIIRTPQVFVAAGSPKPRLVVVQFANLADARAAFDDISQQAAMLLYEGVAEYDVSIVEGYDDFG